MFPRRTLALTCGVLLAAASLAPAYAVDPFPSAPLPPTAPPGTFAQQRLALGGDGLFPNYRIPALAHLGGGVVLASYDGRPTGIDAPGPNSILQRRSTDGGRTWGPQTVIARGVASPASQKVGYSDPSYIVDRRTGKVFNFHVFSKDQGFGGSAYGSNDADRQVLSAAVAESSDGGLTWTSRLITDVVKPATVKGTFASSGEGIQLRQGPRAGRLVQQFAGQIRQPDSSLKFQAYSVFSDDHGATWQMGQPVGAGMDENKVVELSDGRLMMNSRDSDRSGYRKVAYSTDGGQTWGPITLERQLPDPANNASIARLFPDAAPGSADARKLVFSNAASATSRVNGTLRYSCDDGTTWSTARVFEPGSMSYSTITPLTGDQLGLFYEGADSELRYAGLDRAWLGGVCTQLTAAPVTVANGQTATVAVTVRNLDSVTVEGGPLELGLPTGWRAGAATVPTLAPGASATVRVPVTVAPAARAGLVTVPLKVQRGAVALTGLFEVTVSPGATAPTAGLDVFGDRADQGRDLATQPYEVGDQVPYRFRIYNTGNVTATVTPTAGNFSPLLPPAAGNCRYRNLPAFGDFLCSTPKHAVTAAEDADGFFVPDSTWALESTAGNVERRVTGAEVDTRVRRPALDAVLTHTRTPKNPHAADPAHRKPKVGDTITWTLTVTNTGNVRLTDVTAADRRVAELAAGQSLTTTWSHVLTKADFAAGELRATATAKGANGRLAASDLTVAVIPLSRSGKG